MRGSLAEMMHKNGYRTLNEIGREFAVARRTINYWLDSVDRAVLDHEMVGQSMYVKIASFRKLCPLFNERYLIVERLKKEDEARKKTKTRAR